MSTLVALRHIAFEDLGLFEEPLLDHGYRITWLQAGVDDPAPLVDADLAVVLGGPIGVNQTAAFGWIDDEVRALASRLSADRPTLGICLGAQMMAHALGAPIDAVGEPEIGFSPLSLTPAGASSPLSVLGDVPVLHWHGDRFAIPDGAQRLAASDRCQNQAFGKGPNVLGLQFHVEADPALFERWLIAYAGELSDHGIDPRDLRDDARRFGAGLVDRAPRMLEAWLNQIVTTR